MCSSLFYGRMPLVLSAHGILRAQTKSVHLLHKTRTLVPGFFCLSSAMAPFTTAGSEEKSSPVPAQVRPPA